AVHYHVAWLAHPAQLAPHFPAWLLVTGVVGVLLVVRRPRPLAALAYVLFGAVWVIGFQYLSRGWDTAVTSACARTAQAATDPATPVVEGRISHFHPEPEAGHDNERFVVDSVPF